MVAEIRKDIAVYATFYDLMTAPLKRAQRVIEGTAHAANESRNNFKRFRGELLSVMFFGMLLTRVFGGMVKSVWDLIGGGEIFAAILAEVLIPVLLPLLDALLWAYEIFSDLPQPIKTLIGVFILFMAALGLALSLFGALSLGITGLISVLAPLVGWFVGFGTVLSGLATIGVAPFLLIGAAIAVVTLLIISLHDAWKNNFMNMKQIVSDMVSGAKGMISGMIQFAKGLMNVFIGIFTLDIDRIYEGLKMMVSGFKDYILGLLVLITNAIGAVGVGIINLLKPAFDWILDKFQAIRDAVSWVSNTARGILGGGSTSIRGYAEGGPVTAGVPAIVGERGPELFVPNSSGRIIPNGGTAGVNIVQNISVNVSDRREFETLIRNNNSKLVEDLRRLVQI